jgi:hypothetical protein
VDVGAQEVLGAAHGVGVWRSWLEDSGAILRQIRRKISEIRRACPNHPANTKSRLFRTAQGRGRFHKTWVKGESAERDSLCAATDALGEIQTSHHVYLPLVRKALQRLFSNPCPGPAVGTWRALTDPEKVTGSPDWWRSMYSVNAKGLDPGVWENLMALTTESELHRLLSIAEGGKSPGEDGVGIDVYKIAAGARDGGSLPTGGHCLRVLMSIVNVSLRTGISPPSHKGGIIVLVPKPGVASKAAGDRRPITLLPEIGKIVNRVLSSRLTEVFHSHPHILDRAQRANLHDGSARQCLNTTIDVCEDFLERFKKDKSVDLFLTSYDVRKAFDSVQKFSIEATCDRFGLPSVFKVYLLDTLTMVLLNLSTS